MHLVSREFTYILQDFVHSLSFSSTFGSINQNLTAQCHKLVTSKLRQSESNEIFESKILHFMKIADSENVWEKKNLKGIFITKNMTRYLDFVLKVVSNFFMY